MYKPNFCAECGERVARERWRAWTSRRFCAACDAHTARRRVAAAISLAALLLGLGFALGRAGRPAQPPLVVVRGGGAAGIETAPRAEGSGAPDGTADGAAQADSQAAQGGTQAGSGGAAEASERGYGPDGTAGERPTDPLEVVSLCGARTQKGTPCSRRVRGTGRCWQHRGRPAILPPHKLIVPAD